MIDHWIIKILLFPFSLIYRLLIEVRNLLYNVGLLKSISFDFPVISVGNLNTGGSGKTPMIEYLIRNLSPYIEIGVLSRGYKRNTKGYMNVTLQRTYKDVGDEPLFLKRKYPDTPVAVGEERALAIPQMLQNYEDLQAILLDDAFQHRGVKPFLNILLTDYNLRYTKDFLLPMGRLREPRNQMSRAHAIIVTKCPDDLSPGDQESIVREIKPLSYQKVFFSALKYHTAYNVRDTSERILLDGKTVFLLTGIAKPAPMVEFVKNKASEYFHRKFPDHYAFTKHDIAAIVDSYHKLEGAKKIFLTTEKDLIRLEPHFHYFLTHNIDIFALPIEVVFLNYEESFLEWLKSEMMKFRV